MSSWDRKTEMLKYERMFDWSEDHEALIEKLGTPTRVAVGLAKDYVASPPPEREMPWDRESAADTQPQQSTELPDDREADTAPEEARPPAPRRGFRPGGIVVFLLLLLLVGLPIAVALICIGVPFLASGAGVIGAVVQIVTERIAGFLLVSDVLLVLGGGIILIAVGVLLAWLGLWISVSLCRLWIGKVLLPLGGKLCRRKEAGAQ